MWIGIYYGGHKDPVMDNYIQNSRQSAYDPLLGIRWTYSVENCELRKFIPTHKELSHSLRVLILSQ